jgi:type I restriction enzyme S subunit
LVRDGDFVFNKGNSLKFPQGCVYLLQGWGQVAAPNVFICFRLKKGYANGFYQQCFEQNQHGRELKRHITSGARSNGLLNISKETFFGVEIPTPSPAEQQKIAECLSSVDELIAAQARKLDALKTNKKGLMQQLFPREGETQPRLRFPEFQNAGEWETKRVDERGNVLAGKALAVNAPGPLRPYLRTKNVLDGAIDLSDVLTMPMTDAEFNRFEVLDGDILLNEGQSLGLVGRASIYRGEFGQRCAMQNALLRFRAFPSTCPEFAAQAFQQCQKDGTFASIATQTTSVAHLGSSRFSALELAWPPTLAEQQRIADCLTSLDALIAAQTQKHEALKTHKKGLMQQLFPSPEEPTNL